MENNGVNVTVIAPGGRPSPRAQPDTDERQMITIELDKATYSELTKKFVMKRRDGSGLEPQGIVREFIMQFLSAPQEAVDWLRWEFETRDTRREMKSASSWAEVQRLTREKVTLEHKRALLLADALNEFIASQKKR